MGAAEHLGIRLRDYDARIRTFIPHYEEMLNEAAAALGAVSGRVSRIVELGVGSGALAARCVTATPRALVIGIDSDEGMLALARKRLGDRLATMSGDFVKVALPRCDAVTSSFALHHIRTMRRKAAMYARCFAALRPGGMLVNADCCVASDPRLQAQDRSAWRAHLPRDYSRARAERLLRAWAQEDVYLRLEDEVALLRATGFTVDVPWRRGGFAVIVGTKPRGRRRTRRIIRRRTLT